MKVKRFLLVVVITLASLLVLASCTETNDAAQGGNGASESNVSTGQGSGEQASSKKAKKLEIVNKGFTQLEPDSIGSSYISFAAVFKNPNDSQIAEDVNVNITFYNDKDTVVKSVSESISSILPGQSAAVGDMEEAEGAVKMEVQALVDTWSKASGKLGEFTAEDINTSPEEYGGMKTNATLASTFKKDLKNVEAVAVYYNGDAIVGGDFTYVDFAPAGGKVGLEITGSNTIPDVNKTEIYTGFSALTLLDADD